MEELAEEVEVGHERSLEDDGHVRGVEQLDRVRPLLSAVLLILDLEETSERQAITSGETRK